VAFVGVDTEALGSPEVDHAAAEQDNLVDIGLLGLPFDQAGVLSRKIIRLLNIEHLQDTFKRNGR